MSRQVVSATNATEDEEEPLLTTNSSEDQAEAHRLSTKTRIALTCVYLIQILGAFSLTVIQEYIYFTCKDLLDYGQKAALAISLVLASVTYVFSILGGILADIKFGCYKVTFMSCCLLLLGQTVSYVIYIFNNKYQDYPGLIRTFHMIGILFIAVGQGLWNVAVIPLGMRHMYSDATDVQHRRKRQQMYLRWFCFSWSFGQFLSIIYLSIPIYDDLSRPVRQFVASMPMWATGLMTFILIMGKRFYLADTIPLGQRKLQNLIQAAIRRYRGLEMDVNQVLLLRFFALKLATFSSLSAFLAIYFQADGTYLHQLRNLTNSSDDTIVHPIPKRNMSAYHPVFVMATILVLALYGRCAYTCLHWHRVCIGIFFASCSVACAYGVQTYISRTYIDKYILDFHWIIPQYAFLGIAEAFYFLGGYEMCYALSIKGLETLSLGLFFGVGSLFGVLLYTAFVASGHWHSIFKLLFNTLWLLAIVTLALFIYWIMKCVEAREKLDDDDDDDDDDEADDERDEPDDREQSFSTWLEDSSDWSSNNRNRPLRIWENF